MTDLVQRLRSMADGNQLPSLIQAADRIEQLERENAELRNELQVMTNRNQKLWAQLENQSDSNDNPDDYVMQY